MYRSKFKDEHTFEKRKAEAERIRQKYADRIPVRLNTEPTLLYVGFPAKHLNRSSVRRSKSRTSPLLTRKSTWCQPILLLASLST